MNNEIPGLSQINDSDIDKVGHIIAVPHLVEGDEGFNPKIEVFSFEKEGDRAQVYQMWAVDEFANNTTALQALEAFGLAGDSDREQTWTKEDWTQLLEHIAGVTANARHIEDMLERHGASSINLDELNEAATYDSIQKPLAIGAASELETATLVHDIEKPAEQAVSGGGGLENSLDNPVLRDGKLWRWLQSNGVEQRIIQAAQNTGRDDRLYSDYEDYDDATIKIATEQREKLALELGVSVDDVDQMSPSERRRNSIDSKGRMAAIVGVADAMSAQFRFQGLTEDGIDSMSQYYLTRKKDPESVAFFGQDWPEYYKEVRRYLIDQVPEANRDAFTAELDNMNEQEVFNRTVLPSTVGANNPQALQDLQY